YNTGRDQMSGYYDLGTHGRTISTSSEDAQLWFDRGLNWTYAFNHEEAVRCSEKAIAADPNCAIAWWGVAYAAGPNYNKAWDAFDDAELTEMLATTYNAAQQAMALLDHASP